MPAFPFEYVIRSPFAAYYGWKRLKGTQLSFGQSAFPRGGQLTEYSTPVAAINTTSGLTVTTDQLFGVIYNRDCNGAIRSDATPTAAAIVAAMKGCMVGDKFDWVVYNSSSGAFTLTLTPGTGVTLIGSGAPNSLVTQGQARCFIVELTNVTPGSEAVTFWSLGANAA